MKSKKNDQYIRDAAGRGEIPFEEAHWEQFSTLLDQQRQNKKRKRGAILWFLSLLMISGSVWYVWPEEDQIAVPRTLSIENSFLSEEKERKHTPGIASPDPETISSRQEADNRARQVKKSDHAQPSSPAQLVVPKEEERKARIPQGAAQAPLSTNEQSLSPETSAFTPVPKNTKEKTIQEESTQAPASSSPSAVEEQTGEKKEMELPAREEILTTIDSTEKKIAVDDAIREKPADSSLVTPAPPAGKKKQQWKIVGYLGPQFSRQSLEIKGDQGAEAREEHEASRLTLDMGVEINYRLLKNLTLKSGVSYYSIGSRYDLPATSDSLLQLIDNSHWVYEDNSYWLYTDSARTPAGGWVHTDSVYQVMIDSTYQEQTDTAHTVRKNAPMSGKSTVSRVYLPLMIGYEFRFEKYDVGVQGGVGIEYLVSSRGRTIDREGALSGIKEAQALKQVNLSWLLGVSVDRRLNDHWFIGVQPLLRLPFNSSSDDPGIRLRTTAATIRARVGYAF